MKHCGHIGRIFALVASTLGLYCSSVAIRSCDFLVYDIDVNSTSQLPYPFDGLGPQGHVGLFAYRPYLHLDDDDDNEVDADNEEDDTKNTKEDDSDNNNNNNNNMTDTTTTASYSSMLPWNWIDEEKGECIPYPEQFFHLQHNSPRYSIGWQFVTAQISAIGAMGASILGIISLFIDWGICTTWTSYMINCTLFLIAALLQAATYLLYGQREFCYEEYSDDCQVGVGAIYSFIAAGFYYIVSTLLCCLPRPEAYWQGRRGRHRRRRQLQQEEEEIRHHHPLPGRVETSETESADPYSYDEEVYHHQKKNKKKKKNRSHDEMIEHHRQLQKRYEQELIEEDAWEGRRGRRW